jgi:sarcosine oxidase subunit delta
MQIPCPHCGLRDSREFTCKGDAVTLDRPAADAPAGDWHAYLHLRDNPAGPTRELWYHGGGCGVWLVVSRNTATHAVSGAVLASEARHAG